MDLDHNMWSQQQVYLRTLPSQHSQQQVLHPGIINTDDHTHQHGHGYQHHQHHQHYQHHQQHQHHRSTIIDLPSNPRASRNMAEKQRRDNLNTNISTMAALIPIVAGSSRRMDKISILRLAAAFLRTQYTLGCGSTNFLPRQFNEFDLEQYFVDNLVGNGGFFLIITATGKIVYISRQVEHHLGHAQNELLGQSLYNYVYSEDHEELTRNLTPDGVRPVTVPSSNTVVPQSTELANDNSNSSEDSTNHKAEKTKFFREERRCFKIRMSQRAVSRREHAQYECLQVSGILRLAEACKNAEVNTNRTRHREMTGTSNDIVFAGVASLPKKRPITELSIIDANKDEYVTRHLVDGRIIYCDHRVSVVAGYLSEEVSGLSAFGFMHKDDFRWTIIGLRQMYDRAETCGSSCYRLLSKTGKFIYLRTHGYLEYDKDTQTVESFVCINTLISEEEGIELIKEMRERFSATVSGATKAMIKCTDNSSLELSTETQQSDCKSDLEDPTQLEDAITHLIRDLPSPAVPEDYLSPSPMPNSQYVKAAIFAQRFPPAATQANKIGINKIDHYLVINGKDNKTPKQECNTDKHNNEILSNGTTQPSMSDPENLETFGTPLSTYEKVKTINNIRSNGQNEDTSSQSNIFTTRKSNINSCISRNHASHGDASHSGKVLNVQERIEQTNTNVSSSNSLHKDTVCNIKVEPDIEMFDHIEKQEPAPQYFNDTTNNSAVISQETDSHNRRSLKRTYTNEDFRTMRSKKRQNGVYTSINNGHQSVSYVGHKTFVSETGYSSLSVEFNQYNDANSQSLLTAESPNSSLHKIGVDYQQLVEPAAPLIITNSHEEQFANLQDLKKNRLLSPSLDTNPELMMKIFDDLRPVISFEKGFNDTKVHDQTVNDEIRRTHEQLADNIALRESQFNILARDLKNPAFRAQRESLSQLQAEHKIQKQMLKTLQQDHHNIQVNVKPNIGV